MRFSDRHRIVADLVVARRLELAQLQPVERRFAGDRRTILPPRLELARQHRHHRIVAQFVVVIEILVAERDPEHPLANQRRDVVLDHVRPLVGTQTVEDQDQGLPATVHQDLEHLDEQSEFIPPL